MGSFTMARGKTVPLAMTNFLSAEPSARRTIVTHSLIFFTTRKGHVHHVEHISNVVEQFTYLQTIGLN
jgi:hypothetical protein